MVEWFNDRDATVLAGMKARPAGEPTRVLIVLTYYRPHVSGLTIYADRLARELASRGHEVSVLTSRYDHSLQKEELVDGVRIIRVPVFARVSKGVLMPIMLWALREARRHDAVSIHLPQFDGAAVAVAARLMRRPTVLTYHCDLRLPQGLINRLADAVVFAMNYIAGLLAHRIVAYTQDYADHSPLLRRFPRKIRVVPPPVIMPAAGPEEVVAFRQRLGLGAGPIVGSAARFATEKGLEYLIDAVTILQQEHPDIQVLFAGQYVDVVGEADYWAMLQPKIQALGDCWRFLGVLQPDEMPAFYGAVDVLVVSSVNSTESFGLVQVEAMLDGTPVVATALPGVRQPVAMTGMGVVVPPRDARALADGVAEVLAGGDRYLRARHEIEALFDVERDRECVRAAVHRAVAAVPAASGCRPPDATPRHDGAAQGVAEVGRMPADGRGADLGRRTPARARHRVRRRALCVHRLRATDRRGHRPPPR